jgi:hypothetical protein
VYAVSDGLLKDLKVSMSSLEELHQMEQEFSALRGLG